MKSPESLIPVSPEAVAITDALQTAAANAFSAVAHELRSGMSEADIAKKVAGELGKMGVTKYWYDVPILTLIGPQRFTDMADPDYAKKLPSEDVKLKPGDTLFVDMHPRDTESGRWGNLARTIVFDPIDDEQVQMLEAVQDIHSSTITSLTPEMTGAQVAAAFTEKLTRHAIKPLDVRGNFGHNMGSGPKSSFERSFLDGDNTYSLGGQVWGIEPGGTKKGSDGKLLVARFEDCVSVSENGVQKLGQQTIPQIVYSPVNITQI